MDFGGLCELNLDNNLLSDVGPLARLPGLQARLNLNPEPLAFLCLFFFWHDLLSERRGAARAPAWAAGAPLAAFLFIVFLGAKRRKRLL